MATSNTALRVADLDFFSIRNNLKDYLRSQSTFQDYDFEGSGMSVLLDLLAYNTHYNSFYLNMVANESFLDTAQLRQNILSHAKQINYIPASAHGALAKVNIVATPSGEEDNTTTTITLDKYTRLLGLDIDGVNYPFVTINANTSSKIGGSFSFSNVFIKQGEVITLQYTTTANNTQRRYEIPSQNVDTTTISVTVQESAANTYTKEYMLQEDLTLLDANSFVYFVEENENLNYSIYFGDGVLGKKPKDGNIVIITYLDTVGSVANNIAKFTFSEPVAGLFSDNVRVTSTSGSYGGTDKESVDQIRFRAPYAYTAQNRAVTTNDYESILTRDYNNIEAVSIWGGEENDPVVYGKVYMSLKTKGYYALSNLEKEQIKDDLISNRNVLTITPEIIDPEYAFIQVRGKVTYNPRLTTKDSNQLLQIVKNAVLSYNTKELNTFKSTFRKSKLQYYIENSDPSITGSDIYVYLQRQVLVTTNSTKLYEVKFNTPLKKGGHPNEKFYSYPQLTVLDSGAVSRNVFIEEIPESYTGIDRIEIVNPGMNYYGGVTITITGDGTGATATATVLNGKIINIAVTNAGINYTRALVTITGEGSEATAQAILKSKIGTLRTFYYKTNGEKVIVNDNAGSINYETGLVTINAIRPTAVVSNDFYDADILTLNAIPDEEIIPPLRNRILTIDPNLIQSIQVELVAES
ncbi:hypothetical protein EB001_22530 [bacterium]|nr:hypothetical protein [bacterium]